MPCSVFENNETVTGWKMGSSVAYCEACFRELMEKSEEAVAGYDFNESREERVSEKQEERPSAKRKSVKEDKTKRSV